MTAPTPESAPSSRVALELAAHGANLTGLRLENGRLVLTLEADLDLDGLRLMRPGPGVEAPAPAANTPPPPDDVPAVPPADPAGHAALRTGEPRAEIDWGIQIPRGAASDGAAEIVDAPPPPNAAPDHTDDAVHHGDSAPSAPLPTSPTPPPRPSSAIPAMPVDADPVVIRPSGEEDDSDSATERTVYGYCVAPVQILAPTHWVVNGPDGDARPADPDPDTAVPNAAVPEAGPSAAAVAIPPPPPPAMPPEPPTATNSPPPPAASAMAPPRTPPDPAPTPEAGAIPPPAPDPDASRHMKVRYTCPRCHTQGIQAVDRVGQVVRCAQCGKALRLVMK